MRNPEFSHSEERLKEEMWKILAKETSAGNLVDVLIHGIGIKNPDRAREVREYVHDEVLEDIMSSKVKALDFCSARHLRINIYRNKINDKCRLGIPPFLDVTREDARQQDAPTGRRRTPRTINKASVEAGIFLSRLEAVDELSAIIQKVKDPKHRQRFEIMLKGAGLGWSNQEILDEWAKFEGQKLSDARISQTYLLIRQKYLCRKFPHMPQSFEAFRKWMHPTEKERMADKTQDVSKYRGMLLKYLTSLLVEQQAPGKNDEILVIEYLLGRRLYESLVEAGLSTTRKIMLVKDKISTHSGVPFGFLKQPILTNNRPE